MPGLDGTGPIFSGPMTGGGRGRCDVINYGSSMGFGRGRGHRQGRGQGSWPGMSGGRWQPCNST